MSKSNLQIGTTRIEPTYAEAFRMVYCRLLITAADDYWLQTALASFSGYGTSVIGCDAEVGLESPIAAEQTPDGRTGASVLLFAFSTEKLSSAVINRAGQCVMTCPTTALFNGLPDADSQVPLGKHLRFFGDGFQQSKMIDGRRYWRIPVMEGEFLVEELAGTARGIAGGNFLILAADQPSGLAAAQRAVQAIRAVPGVITPFPGGVVRSGSKTGSRYRALRASTAHAFCPTLRGRVESRLPEGVNAVYEIVIDGVDEAAIRTAMAVGIRQACGTGVIAISAGNYGGALGKFHFHLHEILS